MELYYLSILTLNAFSARSTNLRPFFSNYSTNIGNNFVNFDDKTITDENTCWIHQKICKIRGFSKNWWTAQESGYRNIYLVSQICKCILCLTELWWIFFQFDKTWFKINSGLKNLFYRTKNLIINRREERTLPLDDPLRTTQLFLAFRYLTYGFFQD